MPKVLLSSIAVPPPASPFAPISSFGASSSSRTGFTGGLGAGYRFNDYLRFDGTWDYNTGPAKNRSGVVVCPYGLTPVNDPVTGNSAGYLYNTADTCEGFLNVRQHSNTFLANAYLDAGTFSGIFSPYVGGGVGRNINTVQSGLNFYETANGQPYAANLTPFNVIPPIPQTWVNTAAQPIVPQPAVAFAPQIWNRSFSSSSYRVAWSLTAGVGIQLTPSAILDINYRYLNAGESTALINPRTGLAIKENNVSQQIRVGVRYMLQ
jgi:opacity protein-like surface antigen